MDLNHKIIIRAFEWVLLENGENYLFPNEYCISRDVFQARLDTLFVELQSKSISSQLIPLIIAVCGEIGNNSFDHNSGLWSDIPGIYFVSNPDERLVVLADRGQGIKQTIQRVAPEANDCRKALKIAFTKFVSGRFPEHRGNGLKFVAETVAKNKLKLYFQSGDAFVDIGNNLSFRAANNETKGCLSVLSF